MRKPLVKVFIIIAVILMVFISCDENVYMGEYIHRHYYYVQPDGAWQCRCGYVLEGTEKPYITYIKNRQPTEILDLTVEPPIDLEVGVGHFTLNSDGTLMEYTNTGTSGQEVYLRTDSAITDLTIDAAPDVIHRYGTIGVVTILSVANSSYHEMGKVAFAKIKNGRMVLESGSDVRQVHLIRTGEEIGGDFNSITLAKSDDVTLPKITRDPIQVADTGTLVFGLQKGTVINTEKKYYWLTSVGVYEQVVVSDNEKTTKSTTDETVYASASNDTNQIVAYYIANTYTSSTGETEETDDIRVSAKPIATDESGAVTQWGYVVTGTISGEVKENYKALPQTNNTVLIQNKTTEEIDTKITNGTKEDDVADAAKNAKKAADAVEKAEEDGYEVFHEDAKAPTCTEAGYSAYDYYYKDGETKVDIGKVDIAALGHYFVSRWTSDDTHHWHECSRYNKCGTVSEVGVHSGLDSWSYDETGHWHGCSVCSYKTDVENHTLSWEINETQHRQVCSLCDYATEYEDHSYTTVWDESEHWHECECGVKKDVEDHTLIWKNNDTHHWQECSCGYTCNYGTHEREWHNDKDGHWADCKICGYPLVDKEPHTFITIGSTTYCSFCGYVPESGGGVQSGFDVTVKDLIPAGYLTSSALDPTTNKYTVMFTSTNEESVPDHFNWYIDDVLVPGQTGTSIEAEYRYESFNVMIVFWNEQGTGSASITLD